ncbi:MAG: hypothetical protein V3S08_08580 [Phycisphaerales bacterium]
MSGFLSSRYLKYQDPKGSAPTEPSDDDVLLSGGAGARRVWRTGFAIACVCLGGVVAARLMLFVSGVWGVGDETARMYLASGLVLSVLWLIAAWLITPAVLGRRFMFMGTLRWVVRVSQLLWPAGYACWMLGIAAADDRLIMWGRVLRLGAGAGAILLAVMLIAVAGAAQREKAARRFNAVAWLLPILTLLPQAFPSTVAWFFLIPLGMLLLLWAWVMTLYALGVGELYQHVRWGMVDTQRLVSRDDRIARMQRDQDRELAASVRPPPSSLPDIPMPDDE